MQDKYANYTGIGLMDGRLFLFLVKFVWGGVILISLVDVLEAAFPDHETDLARRWGSGVGHGAVALCLIGLGIATRLPRKPVRWQVAWASLAILQVFPAAEWVALYFARDVRHWFDYAEARTHTFVTVMVLWRFIQVSREMQDLATRAGKTAWNTGFRPKA